MVYRQADWYHTRMAADAIGQGRKPFRVLPQFIGRTRTAEAPTSEFNYFVVSSSAARKRAMNPPIRFPPQPQLSLPTPQ